MKIEQHPLFSNQTHQANRDFLYHAVDVYYQMKSLVSGNGTVELCNQLFGGVQVYKGIEQLAFAALVGKWRISVWIFFWILRYPFLSIERGECIIVFIGIGKNKGRAVKESDAPCYAMQHCGIQITRITEETEEFLDMLVSWYFSGDWLEQDEMFYLEEGW